MQTIVFGATTSAKATYEKIKKKHNIVALVDNDPKKWGGGL